MLEGGGFLIARHHPIFRLLLRRNLLVKKFTYTNRGISVSNFAA
jgi:hypothetical protein